MSLEPTVSINSPEPGTGLTQLAGSFVYKFEGNAMRNNISYRICGIGQFKLDAKGQLVGNHTSSSTPLQGSVNGVRVGTYELKGALTLEHGANLGLARIVFTSNDPKLDSVDGKFCFAVAGSPDRLWLMSTGETIVGKSGPLNLSELVIIEAVRMPGG